MNEIVIEFATEANAAVAAEQAWELRGAEERSIADEKEVGIEVVIVHLSGRMGGSAVDFEAEFHFEYVVLAAQALIIVLFPLLLTSIIFK